MNNRKSDLCVAIPIYKDILNNEETSAVVGYTDYFVNYDIFFICPFSLDTKWYKEEFPSIQYASFDDRYFLSNKTYNDMMLNPAFYEAFSSYDYMLIAQTDARIVNPQIDINDFIKLDYDYIGAPWFTSPIIREDGIIKYWVKKCIIRDTFVNRCGNGGFSLRKIQPIVKILNETRIYRKYIWHFNEDLFFSYIGRKKGLNIAPLEDAMQFALEQNMKERIQKGKVPLAVHAWEKTYDSIQELEEDISLMICSRNGRDEERKDYTNRNEVL